MANIITGLARCSALILSPQLEIVNNAQGGFHTLAGCQFHIIHWQDASFTLSTGRMPVPELMEQLL
ncbi:MAG: hypothetical protein F6K47_23340 [Symploca sp. SIO2E6]|nr:hypothetical protein [Symploca sp. SIO2E6]